MEWLDRYRDGQRDQVWHELRQLGAAVREPHHLEQARLVCDEMALRARRNVETAVQILTERGYRFTTNDDDQTPVVPHYPPGPRASAHARWLDERFGLPLAVESWVRIVGDVWFVGTHPAWASAAASDPLVIELEGSRYPESAIGEYFADEHQAWSEWPEARSGRAGPFVLPAPPDRLHKDNTSGGPPYGILVPDRTAEGIFQGEVQMPFMGYLNWVFRNGGFPHTADPSRQAWEIRQAVSRAMLPL